MGLLNSGTTIPVWTGNQGSVYRLSSCKMTSCETMELWFETWDKVWFGWCLTALSAQIGYIVP